MAKNKNTKPKKSELGKGFKPLASAKDQQDSRNYVTELAAQNVGNMESSLQQMSKKYGAAGTVDMKDLPQGNSFANELATQKINRASSNQKDANLLKKIPEYTAGYSQYLRYRYPKIYNPKTDKTGTFDQYLSSFATIVPPFLDPMTTIPSEKSNVSQTTKTPATSINNIGKNAKDRK